MKGGKKLKGLLIAFEGIDGSGKSTQIWKLAQHIAKLNKYNHVVVTREPYRDRTMRRMLRNDRNPYSQAKEIAELYVNDRKAHVKKIITPCLRRKMFVLTDRYSFSTFAYQWAQGLDLKDLVLMHRGLPIPDLVFIIDLPVEAAIKRMASDKERNVDQKFEKDTDFIRKLRANYLKLAKLKKHRVIIIDGTKPAEEIFEKQIKPEFDKIMAEMRRA